MALDDVKRLSEGKVRKHKPAVPPDPAFAERLRLAIGERSRAQVAREAGISWPLLDAYLKGSRAGADKLAKLAIALGVRLEWLATGEGPQTSSSPYATALPSADLVRVPLYPVELGAGPGRTVWPWGEPIGHFDLPLATVRSAHQQISALAGFHVRGRSMEPEIRDGDIAILDLTRTVLPPQGRAIYGIRLDGELGLKRLAWVGDEIEISSVNAAEFPPIRLSDLDAERLAIVGRFWAAFDSRPRTVQE
ncbi:LexA family transcriptional regulator [Falsiroseomonas ponticola]|uniref:LexA family transcriptional regulator n=1 Tax=Falsiroseomonas ponticola TaxID=2786951 RepID=UPI0019322D78|nr:S24 family peptidase [Roseomonas ponticola]